jgi:hypothetical protein
MNAGSISVGRWPGADPNDYRISVTATRRRDRGRKTLELSTFQWTRATGAWSVEPRYRHILEKPDDSGRNVDDAVSHVLSRRGARLSRNRNAWPLSNGFDLPIGIGSLIFDAVRSHGEHNIDIDRLKAVVSQLGSRVVRLEALTATQRRLAEQALYTEILRTLYYA